MGVHSAVALMMLVASTTALRPAMPAATLRRAKSALYSSQTEETIEEQVMTDSQRAASKKTLEFRATKYFFGRVDIFLGPEYKPLSEVFDPSVKDDTTAVAAVVVKAPFGMVIEESATYPGKVEVIEVVEGGNCAAAGVKVGDILRGTTAMAVNIAQSAEEDFGFSIGVSEGTRQRAFFPTDRKKFDLIMAALQSNALTNSGPGEAALVFERKVKESSA